MFEKKKIRKKLLVKVQEDLDKIEVDPESEEGRKRIEHAARLYNQVIAAENEKKREHRREVLLGGGKIVLETALGAGSIVAMAAITTILAKFENDPDGGVHWSQAIKEWRSFAANKLKR